MAWNIPGKNNDNRPGNQGGRNPWPPRRRRGSNGLGDIGDRLRGIFDGGGGGPLRWIAIALVVWLVFNCFVWSASSNAAWCCASARWRG